MLRTTAAGAVTTLSYVDIWSKVCGSVSLHIGDMALALLYILVEFDVTFQIKLVPSKNIGPIQSYCKNKKVGLGPCLGPPSYKSGCYGNHFGIGSERALVPL